MAELCAAARGGVVAMHMQGRPETEKLGCPVVAISALKGTGIKEAADKAVDLAKKAATVTIAHSFADSVEAVISSVEAKIGSYVADEQKLFFAIKLIEKDDKIKDMMKSVPDVSAEVQKLEDEFDDDTESIITNERYQYISSIIHDCCTKSKKSEGGSVSDKIDKVVTNRWAALPIFAAVMFLVYYISVTTVGSWATDWANDGVFGDGWHLFVSLRIFCSEFPPYVYCSNETGITFFQFLSFCVYSS